MTISIKTNVNVKKVASVIDIDKEGRLFYEIGYYRDEGDPDVNYQTSKYWTGTGEFKEVKNVEDFLLTEKRLNNIEFIRHHNFLVIDQDQNLGVKK